MKTLLTFLLAAIMVLMISLPLLGQDKMSRDEWQAQMTTAKSRVAQLQAQIAKLDSDKTLLQFQSTKLDADLRACEDALYAMLGITRADAEAFEKELSDMEKRVDEMQKMPDAELVNHRDELERMQTRSNEMLGHKMAMIPRYAERIHALQDKVAALLQSISKEKTYTVGSWARNRDCLWNIAKKKDIYDNAWMWPKIWQGNRDKIKDPDMIKPKWVLKIPAGKELSKEEKSAANRYYRKKAAAPAGQ
jgi:nucleoid-associated protein YgaU